MTTIVITPSLVMGTDVPTTMPYVRCETADEAYDVITASRTKVAWIPRDDEPMARDVLGRLGLGRDWVDGLFCYARTGRAQDNDSDRILPPA